MSPLRRVLQRDVHGCGLRTCSAVARARRTGGVVPAARPNARQARTRSWLPTIVGLAAMLAACAPSPPADVEHVAPPANPPGDATATWLARGADVYARNCAVCHGARGEGQPNWAVPLADGSLPAPPLDADGHAWHHADGELANIILNGGTVYSPDSRMPAFGATLSADDVLAVLAHIKTSWGAREASYQADMTLQWEAAANPH